MTIEITTTMKLICPYCGETATYNGGSKMGVIKQAREDGWALGLDAICPYCQSDDKPSSEVAK